MTSLVNPNDPLVVHGLAGLRRSVNLTQEQVAQRMGITQQSVNRIERNWPAIHVGTLIRYVEACGGEVSIHADFGYRRFILR